MKVAIIGADGFLGSKAKEVLLPFHDVIAAGINSTENRLDASNLPQVIEFLKKNRPEVVLDVVALTSSLKCEENPVLAEKLNFITAKNISQACEEIGCWMVFISSSYLFDGKKGDYSENEETIPMNEYARTKIMAEKVVLNNPKGIVLRVDLMYGFNGLGRKNGVFDQILSGKEISLRDPSQTRHPIFVEDVPRIMLELVSKRQKGVFHLAGPEKFSMLEFLQVLEKIVRKDSKIKISSGEPSKLQIPKNATLNTNKVKDLGIKFTPIDVGLKKIQNQLFSWKI